MNCCAGLGCGCPVPGSTRELNLPAGADLLFQASSGGVLVMALPTSTFVRRVGECLLLAAPAFGMGNRAPTGGCRALAPAASARRADRGYAAPVPRALTLRVI